MLLTTTSEIPGAKVTQVLGVVQGASSKPTKGQKFQESSKEAKDSSLAAMWEEAKALVADAVIDVRLQFNNTSSGLECFAVGTAVSLDELPRWHLKSLQSEGSTEPNKEHVDTEAPEPSAEEVKIEAVFPEKENTLEEYQKALGIDRNRADALFSGGFTDMEKIKSATVLEIRAVPGMNPTVARIIKDKAMGT
jgi:uncharacterized protein YbjQ (UPF0145 family)